METAGEARGRPAGASPADNPPAPNARGWAWAVLLISGADGLVLNVWHAVHTSLPTPLAVMVGSVPILLATGLTEVVSRSNAGRMLWALTFTVMVGTMGLSVAGQASVLHTPFGSWSIAVAYPLIMDLATLVALSTITTGHRTGNASGNTAGSTPETSPPTTVSDPANPGGKQSRKPTETPGGKQTGKTGGQPASRPQGQTPQNKGQGRPQEQAGSRQATGRSAPSWTVEALADQISRDYADAETLPSIRALHARYGGRTATVSEAAKRVRTARATNDAPSDGPYPGPVSPTSATPEPGNGPGGKQAEYPTGSQGGKHGSASGGKQHPPIAVPAADATGNVSENGTGNTSLSHDDPAGDPADAKRPALRLVTPDTTMPGA